MLESNDFICDYILVWSQCFYPFVDDLFLSFLLVFHDMKMISKADVVEGKAISTVFYCIPMVLRWSTNFCRWPMWDHRCIHTDSSGDHLHNTCPETTVIQNEVHQFHYMQNLYIRSCERSCLYQRVGAAVPLAFRPLAARRSLLAEELVITADDSMIRRGVTSFCQSCQGFLQNRRDFM